MLVFSLVPLNIITLNLSKVIQSYHKDIILYFMYLMYSITNFKSFLKKIREVEFLNVCEYFLWQDMYYNWIDTEKIILHIILCPGITHKFTKYSIFYAFIKTRHIYSWFVFTQIFYIRKNQQTKEACWSICREMY